MGNTASAPANEAPSEQPEGLVDLIFFFLSILCPGSGNPLLLIPFVDCDCDCSGQRNMAFTLETIGSVRPKHWVVRTLNTLQLPYNIQQLSGLWAKFGSLGFLFWFTCYFIQNGVCGLFFYIIIPLTRQCPRQPFEKFCKAWVHWWKIWTEVQVGFPVFFALRPKELFFYFIVIFNF